MLSIFGLDFSGLELDYLLKADSFMHVVTVNAEFIVRANEGDVRLKDIINSNVSTFDGQVPFLLAKIKSGFMNFDKISGSDLIFLYALRASKNVERLFLLGASRESNRAAVDRLKNEYKVDAAGFSPDFSDYPFSEAVNAEIIDKISKFKPKLLFVGFGAVKQEYWIDDNREILRNIGVLVVVGCGGSIDFLSGTQKRAPRFVQILCLEGIYRFFREPKPYRMARLLKSFRIFKYIKN